MEPTPPVTPEGGAVCAVHPDAAATGTCVRCGAYVCGGCEQQGHCPGCVEFAQAEPILFEQDPLPVGFPSAVFKTIGQMLTEPKVAFRARSTFAPQRPVVFAAMMIAFNLTAEAAWSLLVYGDVWDAAGVLAILPVTPILILLQVLVTHGCLALIGGTTQPLRATLRVYCYATAPLLFSFWLLQLPASIWNVIIVVVGLRETHRCGTFKALVAVLLPACVVLIGALFFLGAFARGPGGLF